ncbi:MAG: hypothetical protein IPN74_03060 [Haliscomenobacter sp.]|nr:hypothetical protein [Haliscomenobacter sp.]
MLAVAPMVILAALVKVPPRFHRPLAVTLSILISPPVLLLNMAWLVKPFSFTPAIAPMVIRDALLKVAASPLYKAWLVERSILISPPVLLLNIAVLVKLIMPTEPTLAEAPMVISPELLKVF